MALPTDKQARKNTPIYSGVLKYFPDALAEVARVSFIGNQQHNPGEPLHWAKEKSQDEPDACVRHLMESENADGTPLLDEDNTYHAAKAAWRALAHLQRMLDKVNAQHLLNTAPNALGMRTDDSGAVMMCYQCGAPLNKRKNRSGLYTDAGSGVPHFRSCPVPAFSSSEQYKRAASQK